MGHDDGDMYKTIEIRFIDSCRFMASSLDKLASNLIGLNTAGMKCQQCADFQSIDAKYVASVWCKNCESNTTKQLDKEQLTAIQGNGTTPKEAFYSKLNMKKISDNDYKHGQKVWKCITPEGAEVNIGDYHNVYLVADVLLLTDIFQGFRGVCQENYKLDPTPFYSAPGLAWKAALKYTGIKLELLTDPDMLLMFEKGIRDGITQAVHRYVKANNQYMGEQYDPEVESSYLQYLDANNLYGLAICQDLPTHGFKWLSKVETFTEKRIGKLVADNKHGYILEVDINYPKSLHDKHNELPFLPERKVIHKVEKLIPNLEHKRKYVVHIRALHQALKHGLELKKVYRVIQFSQKPWLRGYIDHNTSLRTAAKNEFEKDFYKLMNLPVFGKTMENLRNHHNIQLVTNEEKYTKLVMKPNFKGGNYFSSRLMGVEMCKTEVKMNKPVYIGQAILDNSKIVMHDFHYDYMQPKYGRKLRICYMATDSFVYHIRTEDFYRDISDDLETRFDTSAYSKDDNRPLSIGKNKKVVGLMTDELNGKIMTDFITLRAKLYAYKSLTKEGGDRKAKVALKTISAAWRMEVNKPKLNRADDKWIVQPDHITTLARALRRTDNGRKGVSNASILRRRLMNEQNANIKK
ncbi:uncharacterized protein LOC130654274 [Hydractinia symbiolongicarpus]|uniref:uncharacterized protein LOC130654274 n=1 Tax=Hydractinia symbiolongicarpus TaxID=13093 RepID=UPI002549C7B1|nr:uncharacterized protein LOC130654274 [Hydractinia symbiolongicarpus]